MNIAFCINNVALAGLGVTVSSLLQNCSNTQALKLWFFCAGLSEQEKNKIKNLLTVESFYGEFSLIDFDPKAQFGTFTPLHGDWTAYGRLLIGDFIHAEKVLYLDADLVVELDVLQIDDFNFDGYVLAAVSGGGFKYALGNKFYINKIGIPPDLDYFNSGVLLLNLPLWQSKKVKEKCLEIAKKYHTQLPSHDQSLLNIYCAGNFGRLPPSFNCIWLPIKPKPKISNKMILHFIGSPKPWAPFGFLLHNGYKTWKEYSKPEWSMINSTFTLSHLKRTWNIRRSYFRLIINRIKAL